jgi:hypothetical protein
MGKVPRCSGLGLGHKFQVRATLTLWLRGGEGRRSLLLHSCSTLNYLHVLGHGLELRVIF